MRGKPESETPEVDDHLTAFPMVSDNDVANLSAVRSFIALARSLERRLSLAQTEIKGHMRIAKEIRIEALKEAAEACELERVAAEETGDEGDIAYNLACQHCATAIRALLLKSRA